jgi:hypothetical protein
MKGCDKILPDGSKCPNKHKAKGLCTTHYNYYLQENHIKKCRVEGCTDTYFCVDYCVKHYARYKKYEDHDRVRTTHEGLYQYNGYAVVDKTPQDFMKRKTRVSETGCIEWIAKLSDTGYGQVGYYNYGKMYGFRAAHRLAYFLHYGDFDRKLFVCHKCDNPKCVNPEHLFLGTAKDNSHDMCNKKILHKKLGCEHEKVKEDGWYHWHECAKCGKHAWFEKDNALNAENSINEKSIR